MKSNTVERIQIDHHRVLWDSLIKEGNTFPWSVFHITPEYSMCYAYKKMSKYEYC